MGCKICKKEKEIATEEDMREQELKLLSYTGKDPSQFEFYTIWLDDLSPNKEGLYT